MNNGMHFTINGPCTPKGRPRIIRIGGFSRMKTPEKTATYEAVVRLTAEAAMREKGWRRVEKGPVFVNITIYRAMLSTSKKRQRLMASGMILPATRPDLDNQVKSVIDGLNGIAFKDDGQVASLVADKRFDDGDGERVFITIAPLDTAKLRED